MKKIIISLLISLSFFHSTFAINPQVDEIYGNFLSKLQRDYTLIEQELILESLSESVERLKDDSRFTDKIDILRDIQSLNYDALYDIQSSGVDQFIQQKNYEQEQIKGVAGSIDTSYASFVNDVTSLDRVFIPRDSNNELVEDGEIYRMRYDQYFELNADNTRAFLDKKGIILKESDDSYRFVESYKKEKKIAYSDLANLTRDYVEKNDRVVKRGGRYYGYIFDSFKFFPGDYGVYQSDFDSSNIELGNVLLYFDGEKYNFVEKFTERKLIDEESISGVPNRERFLEYLRDDSLYASQDFDRSLEEIRNIAQTLSKGKSEKETITAIYDWILSHVEYSQIINLDDAQIFSGIEAYENQSGVCTGYTKLSYYLFSFAGIDDVEVIRGHVIDADDFPEIGHAWLRIGDVYYDPTFDDPIGAKYTKTLDEYKYFGLPKDIFYANRYDFGTLPEEIRSFDSEEITEHIYENLEDMLPKYRNNTDEYPVFNEILFRQKYRLGSDRVTPEILAQKVGSFTVENNNFRYSNNGDEIQMKRLEYYTITGDNTEDILDIFLFNPAKFTLFYWQKEDNSWEWRVGYNIKR